MIDKNKVVDLVNQYTDLYEKMRHIEKRDLGLDELLISNPIKVYVEPTNRCNLNCKFCARSTMDRPYENMSFEMFKRIIDDLKKGSNVIITGQGEPLINPAIYDMITYANQGGGISVNHYEWHSAE